MRCRRKRTATHDCGISGRDGALLSLRLLVEREEVSRGSALVVACAEARREGGRVVVIKSSGVGLGNLAGTRQLFVELHRSP